MNPTLLPGWLLKIQIWFRHKRYPGTQLYWERRYQKGGRSGAGSVGEVARFKAIFLNKMVSDHLVSTVVELGCGDGDQLALAQYPSYTGLDIAPTAVAICAARFKNDTTKTFAVYQPDTFEPGRYRAEMAISLEVIFHLTEAVVYQAYMEHLFALSTRWVVIFASNIPDRTGGLYPHFRTREWLPDVPEGWILRQQEVCPFQTMIPSSFFVFEKRGI